MEPGTILVDTETSVVEVGDDGGVDVDRREVGARTSILEGISEALQLTFLRSPTTCHPVPRTTVLVGVTEALQVTSS